MNEFIEKLIGRLEERKNHFGTLVVVGKDDLVLNYNLGKMHSFEDSIEIVNQLAEEYNNGWIPCSERLPSEGQTVLVQDFEDYYEVCNCETKNGIKGFSSWEWWSSANNYLAWQPLPAPYQPKGE